MIFILFFFIVNSSRTSLRPQYWLLTLNSLLWIASVPIHHIRHRRSVIFKIQICLTRMLHLILLSLSSVHRSILISNFHIAQTKFTEVQYHTVISSCLLNKLIELFVINSTLFPINRLFYYWISILARTRLAVICLINKKSVKETKWTLLEFTQFILGRGGRLIKTLTLLWLGWIVALLKCRAPQIIFALGCLSLLHEIQTSIRITAFWLNFTWSFRSKWFFTI